MDYRLAELARTQAGYEQTGRELVATHAITGAPFYGPIGPAGVTDDVGLYYFVPKIARAFHLDMQTAARLFFSEIIVLGAFLGMVGCLLLFRSLYSRLLGIFAVGATSTWLLSDHYTHIAWLFDYDGGGLYAIPATAVFATIPLALFFLRMAERLPTTNLALAGIFFFFAGLALEFSSLVRVSAGTGPTVVIAMFTAARNTLGRNRRILLLAGLGLGVIASSAWMDHQVQQRDEFLERLIPSYEPVSIHHPFWHAAYLGLGYIANGYGISFSDNVARSTAAAYDASASYLSPAYDRALQKAVSRLWDDDPNFIIQTLAAKIGVMVAYGIYAGNVGLLSAFKWPKGWRVDLPFALGILVEAGPGIVGMPFGYYVTGFLAMVMLYGLLSLDHAITTGASAWLRSRLRAGAKVLVVMVRGNKPAGEPRP